MMPILLLFLAVAAIYVGTIETAFSSLMRLSLRLMAERGRNDRLGFYLDDPIQLFLPARLLLGLIFSLATVVIAVMTGRVGFQSIGLLLVFVAVFILVFEHVLPLMIVRRNPERVLEILLPPFDMAVRFLQPFTTALTRLIGTDKQRPAAAAPGVQEEAQPTQSAESQEEALIEGDGRRLLQSIVDFGDTLVREVMTPRPDIVAIRVDATLDALRALFREQEYRVFRSSRRTSTTFWVWSVVKDLIQLAGTERQQPSDYGADSSGHVRARDQAGARAVEGVPAQASPACDRRRRVRRHRGPGRRSRISSRRSSARFAMSTTSKPSRSSRRRTGPGCSAPR